MKDNKINSLNEYQDLASKTAIYPHAGEGTILGLAYTALGLGEAGEVQNKVKKIIRDDNNIISDQKKMEIAKELGGNLWYISQCAKELGFTLSEIATININELYSRMERGVITGSGDNR
jgi:NTP pyrophosphatase (non-canonical NTP hydrolase)